MQVDPHQRSTVQYVLENNSLFTGIGSTIGARTAIREMSSNISAQLTEMQLQMKQQQEELLAATQTAAAAVQEEVKKGNAEVLAAVGQVHHQVISTSSSLQRRLMNLGAAVERQEQVGEEKLQVLHAEMREGMQQLHDSCTSSPALEKMAVSLQQLQQSVQEDSESKSANQVLGNYKLLREQMQMMEARLVDQIVDLKRSQSTMARSTYKLVAAAATGLQEVFYLFMFMPLQQSFLEKMKPGSWLKKPMVLLPICNESMQPVGDGFVLKKPKEWVKKHPVMVKMTVLALQVLIKVAATQVTCRPCVRWNHATENHELISKTSKL